jgi:uncharacterized membrane protein YgcG
MRRAGMTFPVFVKLTLVMLGFAALLAAFDDDGFVPSLAYYFACVMGLILLSIVTEGYVAPWMRRRLPARGSHGSSSSSSSSSYSGDGSSGGASDCGWSDSGGGSGGGDGGGSC